MELDRTAASVNKLELDVLLVASYEQHAYDLIDLVDVPCIAHLCTGSDVLHHEKVSFQVYCQPQADLFVRGKRLFSAITRSRFGDGLVYEGPAFYDRRGMDMMSPRPAWKERRPLIFWHGSLYKIACGGFLDCICRILQADKNIEFVFMGKDDGTALSIVNRHATKMGVRHQVRYEGAVVVGGMDSSGRPVGHGAEKVMSYLAQARLWPDSWPMGGGAARFEAYACGVPSAHMGVSFEPECWGRRQNSTVELPAMTVRRATAFSVDEYEQVCRRCLYDEAFADTLAPEQMETARKLCDPAEYWRRILAFYANWLDERCRR